MTAEIKHGTYSGYQQHRKQGIPYCAECRKANNAYHRERHKKDTEGVRRQKADAAARARAFTKLKAEHPDEYADLLAAEREAAGIERKWQDA